MTEETNFFETEQERIENESKQYKQYRAEEVKKRLESLNVLFSATQTNNRKIEKLKSNWIIVICISLVIGYPLTKNQDVKSQTVGVVLILIIFLLMTIYTCSVLLKRKKIAQKFEKLRGGN